MSPALTHRVNYEAVRALVSRLNTLTIDQLEAKRQTLADLDNAFNAYGLAAAKWRLDNTDETMINLIGAYSRFTRIAHQAEKHYG